MICFPLDNTAYKAIGLGAWCGTRTRGVFSADGHYAVTANNDMTVTISPGLAWLKVAEYWGVSAFQDVAITLPIDPADGAEPRIDAVCVRIDKNRNVGEVVIKKGDYAGDAPTVSTPTRNTDFDEIYIATVAVNAGAVSVTQADITDQRLNEIYCGIMRDGVTGIPTQQLQNQWTSWMRNFTKSTDEYYQQYKAMVVDLYTQYAAEVATHGKNAQNTFDEYVKRITAFEDKAKSDFDKWFESVQDILSEDVAGNLLNLINALPDKFYTKDISDQNLTNAISEHNNKTEAHGLRLQNKLLEYFDRASSEWQKLGFAELATQGIALYTQDPETGNLTGSGENGKFKVTKGGVYKTLTVGDTAMNIRRGEDTEVELTNDVWHNFIIDGDTINFSNGGTGGYNFKIVGGTDKPVSPVENTIWRPTSLLASGN